MFAAGGPLFGLLSDRVQRRKWPFALGAGIMAAGFALLSSDLCGLAVFLRMVLRDRARESERQHARRQKGVAQERRVREQADSGWGV